MKRFNAYDFFIEEKNIRTGNGGTYMIVSEKERITYDEFHINVTEKYALFFSEISDCSRLGIMLSDSVFQQILYWGAIKNEITPALFSVLESQDSVIRTVKNAYMDILISDDEHRELLNEVSKECNICRAYIVDENGELKLIYYDGTKPKKETEGKFILFSSGTTGISKGVIHNQQDMKYAAETYGRQILELNNKDIMYSMAHLNYGFAFTNSTFQTFYGGATAIIDRDTDIWTIAENIKKFKPTVLCGVPALFEALAGIVEQSDIDLSSIRLALSSGEKMSERLWDIWYDNFNIPIIEGYGSVEMLTNVISNRKNNYCKGSSGKLIEGFEAEFRKIAECDSDFTGVLNIKGRSISNCSIVSEEEQSDIYKTNDIFCVDKNGFFWYKGRIDDVYKVNGVWFNPLSVEKFLESIPYISHATVVNIDMDIIACIIVNDPNAFSFDEARKINYCLKHGKGQIICPCRYILVDELPRNSNGKKLRIKPNAKAIIKVIEV